MTTDLAAHRAEIERLSAEVQAHCLCLYFESDATHYRVIYPDGFFPNGAQVSKGLGKARALQKLLDVMERHWKESFA